jgi:hypothetical protein
MRTYVRNKNTVVRILIDSRPLTHEHGVSVRIDGFGVLGLVVALEGAIMLHMKNGLFL